MLDVIYWYVILGALSLITGDMILRVLERILPSGRIPDPLRLAVVFHIVPILGYAVFWIHMCSVTAGVIIASLMFLCASAAGLFQLYRHGTPSFLADDDSKVQSLIMLCVPSIFLLVIALPLDKDKYADNPPQLSERIGDFFHAKTLFRGSPDYLIQNVYTWSDSPWSYTLCPFKTTIADRPPVIGGTALLFKTPDYLRTPNVKNIKIPYFLGIAVFCCVGWIPACWGLLRSLDIPVRKCSFLIVILGFSSPFIFFNTTFCWPKMLGGTYMLVAYLLVDRDFRARDALGRLAVPLSAVFVGFSLLCHMINALVVPFILGYLFIKREIRVSETVVCGTIVLGIIASWYVPKMIFEAPHPSMVRYLLADARNETIFFSDCSDCQAIMDSYKQHSMREILVGKYHLVMKSLPSLTLTRADLVNSHNLFTSHGHILFATAIIGLLYLFKTKTQSRILRLKKLIFYLFLFMLLYGMLATLSYWLPPCSSIFPASALLLSLLALLLGASYLQEKCLLLVAGTTFVLWLYLYLDCAAFVQLLLLIVGGILFIGIVHKKPIRWEQG